MENTESSLVYNMVRAYTRLTLLYPPAFTSEVREGQQFRLTPLRRLGFPRNRSPVAPTSE